MKINTKILFVTGISVFTTVAVGIFFYFSFLSFDFAVEKNRTSSQISVLLFERRLLLDEYLIYNAERPHQQWVAETNNLVAFVKTQSVRFSKDYEKQAIDSILKTSDSSREKFLELVALFKAKNISSADSETTSKEQEARLLGQLINLSQEGNDAANRLSTLSSADIVAAQKTIVYSGAGCLLVLLLVSLAISYIWRGIARQIVKLHEGTEIIGEGNLDYKVGTKTKDELGQLSRSFDEMAEKMKAVYSSLEEKNKELHNKIEDLTEARTAILNVAEDAQEERQIVTEEKDKINAILHSIGDGVFVVDKDYKIMIFNEVAVGISGFSVEEAIGRPYDQILKFVYETDGKTNDTFIKEAISTGEPKEMSNHTVLITKDGSKVAVADSAAPLLGRSGEVIGCVVVFRDVTKERAIDKAKTEFVSLASHQLRTPVTAIKWYSEMLLNKKNEETKRLSKKQLEYIEQVYYGNERMIELINNLLNVSRIEMGKISAKNEVVDVKKLLENIIGEQKVEIVKRKHKLIVNQPEGVLKILTDPVLLTTVFQNFLSNAIRYTLDKGEIICTIKKKNSKILFSISDNGVGIPKDEQSKVFDRFFRATNSLGLNKETNGLGLYIVKQTAAILGGRVWFESELGKGSTFYFELPEKA